jgi:uncharacterized membrane protein HdeD (DUF308 family)
MSTAHSSFDYGSAGSDAHPRWGWFVGLGVILILLAVLAFANLLAATVASVLFIGAMMTVGAVFQVIHAFQVQRWSGFAVWLLSGVLYGIAGVVILFNPLLGAATLTLLFAVSLIVSGAFRIVWGYKRKPLSGWGWLLASGIVTLLVGLLFLIQWPANALFLLGIVLAIDLTFQGVAWLVTGLELRRAG